MSPTSVADPMGPVERQLPPQPTSVGEARRLVREVLEGTGRVDLAALAENAVLLTSEVVTNAILHAGTTVDLVVRLDGGVRIEVADGSEHLPVRRRYATTAGTGRGLMMLEEVADAWGVQRRPGGKVVWFELGRGADTDLAGVVGSVPKAGAGFEVELRRMPLLLHQAWQEHAEALLREYLLVTLEEDGDDDPIQVHAEATDAIAVLEEHVPRPDVAVTADELMADAVEPRVTAERIRVPVPLGSVAHFDVLDRTIDAALALARDGLVLTTPTQPEIRSFRRWVCGEVRRQAEGEQPREFHVEHTPMPPSSPEPVWDVASVRAATTGRIAADEANRILAVSPAALALLGYDDPAELVGNRLVTIIPERFRQAHIAGFTMYLLVGRQPLLGQRVTLPAMRRDGSEVLIELLVSVEDGGDGRSVFVADLVPAES